MTVSLDPTGVVALTDDRWFRFLGTKATDGRLDEANFWRPRAQTEFHALSPGGPFFLRLKSPINAIAGYGFFAASALLPLNEAWRAFEWRNGDPDLMSFVTRIGEYRGQSGEEALFSGRPLRCLVLRNLRLLPKSEWLSWAEPQRWPRNLQGYKPYSLHEEPGRALVRLLRNGHPEELSEGFRLATADQRQYVDTPMVVREGQGTFRVRILDAYGRRCAVTGERSEPTLEAAHIQPYLGPASNHVQNGIALRADIHRLFDGGYVTVTPDLRFRVSPRLRQEFENGRDYYKYDGAPLAARPSAATCRPSEDALEWHNRKVFR
ncbi:MAG: HNH endonuclease [Candidatus Eisenbacteria bacterium]|nr:HNH endonuclease [Candidatus Eisenbacteria bacterium]